MLRRRFVQRGIAGASDQERFLKWAAARPEQREPGFGSFRSRILEAYRSNMGV